MSILICKINFSQHKIQTIAIVFSILFLFSTCKTTNKTISSDKIVAVQGPIKVKNKLIEKGVFNTPNFEFTNTYISPNNPENIKGLFFNGLDFKGKPTKVFCWYGEPKNIDKTKKTPAVILVHGGGGTAFPQWVKEWIDRGYIAISIALEGQVPGERIDKKHPTFQFSGPQRIGFFNDVVTEDLENQWFFHAVADVLMAKSLLKSFPQVDATKIGITGISWGGILTNVITGLDDSFAFSIPVYGCGFLQETPLYKKQLARLSKEQQEFYLQNWEPSLYIPLQKQPTLFVNGTNDKHFTMNSFTKSFNASKAEKYLYVEHTMKHGHAPGWKPKTIYEFADYVIKDGNKPQTVTFKNLDSDNNITYSFTGNVESSKLYYTTNFANWGEDKYTWLEADAKVNNNEIKAILPKNTVAYFLNTINKKGIVYSVPMTILKK